MYLIRIYCVLNEPIRFKVCNINLKRSHMISIRTPLFENSAERRNHNTRNHCKSADNSLNVLYDCYEPMHFCTLQRLRLRLFSSFHCLLYSSPHVFIIPRSQTISSLNSSDICLWSKRISKREEWRRR